MQEKAKKITKQKTIPANVSIISVAIKVANTAKKTATIKFPLVKLESIFSFPHYFETERYGLLGGFRRKKPQST